MTDITRATPSAVEVVKREECFKGFYKLDRVHLRHELFAGGMSREISREVFVRHDAVCVLPYDPQRDEVVLIEQFRVTVRTVGKINREHLDPAFRARLLDAFRDWR